jgi:hypothetical protein
VGVGPCVSRFTATVQVGQSDVLMNRYDALTKVKDSEKRENE